MVFSLTTKLQDFSPITLRLIDILPLIHHYSSQPSTSYRFQEIQQQIVWFFLYQHQEQYNNLIPELQINRRD